jgi:hypothetical protein
MITVYFRRKNAIKLNLFNSKWPGMSRPFAFVALQPLAVGGPLPEPPRFSGHGVNGRRIVSLADDITISASEEIRLFPENAKLYTMSIEKIRKNT